MLFEATYRRPSEVATSGGEPLAFLASRLESPAAPELEGQLFTGAVLNPLGFRRRLLGLHTVVTSRFDWIASSNELDPVITVGSETLRLEGFSECAGAYARVDLLKSAFADGQFGPAGTTNVDLSAPFVRQLSALRPDRGCRLEVGPDSLRLETHRGEAIERKVPLPERWVRGFLQVQAAQARAEPVAEIAVGAARALVHNIPSQAKGLSYVDFRTRMPRLLSRAPHGGDARNRVLEVPGIHRLRLLQDLLPGLLKTSIFRVPETKATVWVCEGVGTRFSLALSGGVNRGFSGDGDALLHLGAENLDPAGGAEAEAVRQALELDHEASIEQLMIRRRGTASEIRRQLDILAARGLVGFDRGTGRYFYRVLPFTRGLGPGRADSPRWRGAQALLAQDAVEMEEVAKISGGWRLRGWVRSTGGDYRVSAAIRTGRLVDGHCTCTWVRRHGLERGPCKHLLALRLRAEHIESARVGSPNVDG